MGNRLAIAFNFCRTTPRLALAWRGIRRLLIRLNIYFEKEIFIAFISKHIYSWTGLGAGQAGLCIVQCQGKKSELCQNDQGIEGTGYCAVW
jgi:hypothetical protein